MRSSIHVISLKCMFTQIFTVAIENSTKMKMSHLQKFFFLSVLFHHSNLRLPERLERALALVLTTPRMHAIHHSTVKAETDSNWTSGLSWSSCFGAARFAAAELVARQGRRMRQAVRCVCAVHQTIALRERG